MSTERHKIAIVGIGGVFPGADNLREFWDHIRNANSCVSEPGSERWPIADGPYYSDTLQPDRVNSRHACLIDDSASGLDWELHSDIGWMRELDPGNRLLLSAGHQAWKDCSQYQGGLDRRRAGVVIGNIVLPTEHASRLSDAFFLHRFEQQLFPDTASAPSDCNMLGRHAVGLPAALLAHALCWGGGAWTLDAACASSLYAIKYAADELLAERADLMLAGGLSRPDSLYTQMGFSQLQAISRSGRCCPFDHKADGLVVGEGSGMLVLKRLADARADGDRIYATIVGIGLGNDIGGNLMQPDASGQLRVMRSAFLRTGWTPDMVQHIECHGTGTPLGDRVEFDALSVLWSDVDGGSCVIGSVKSNIGHLLTAAGAASMIKTLLAMREQCLPPTANFECAAKGIELEGSPFHVLRKAQDWHTAEGVPRRAAVSGFGFGGINAHILLEEYTPAAIRTRPPGGTERVASHAPAAIVGMAIRLGESGDRAQVAQALLQPTVVAQRACREIELPMGNWAIPPADLKESLPQQLLMLDVADAALRDAGLEQMDEAARLRTGVFIGVGLDMHACSFHFRWVLQNLAPRWWQRLGGSGKVPEAWLGQLRDAVCPPLSASRTLGALGSIVASRIARTFRLGGPCFTVSSEETSGGHALCLALRALRSGELDQVIVGAVDLSCEPRSMQAADISPLAGDRGEEQSGFCDAAIAFVLRAEVPEDNKIYAMLNGVAQGSGKDWNGLETALLSRTLRLACSDGGLSPGHLAYLESVCDERLPPELPEATFQTGGVCAKLGYAGAASTLLAVARGVMALAHCQLPAHDGQLPKYWLHDRATGLRHVGVNGAGLGGNYVGIVLSEPPCAADAVIQVSSLPLPVPLPRLLLCQADSREQLLSQLSQLRIEHSVQSLLPVSGGSGLHRLALLATDSDQLERAIHTARQAIVSGIASVNPDVCYTPAPLYAQGGRMAFVFPGSGNHFPDMGRELGRCFPEVLEQLHRENQYLRSQHADGHMWDGKTDFTVSEAIFAQVCLGVTVHDVMASFGVRPQAVMGYSLGETAGLFATRTWRDRDAMLERIRCGDLFHRQLAGPCLAAQRSWGCSEAVDWVSAVVRLSAVRVKQVLSRYPRVYLLIRNTEKESVIGGEREAVLRFAREQGCHTHIIPCVPAVHCEIVAEVARQYRELHLFETTPPTGTAFYSCAKGGAIVPDRDSAAEAILQQALHGFDYPRLVNQAWEDGVRLFVELGPGASCTRMIHTILGERPHYADALCVRRQDSVGKLLHVLASLYCHGVDIDPRPLLRHWQEMPTEVIAAPSLRIPVRLPDVSIQHPDFASGSPSNMDIVDPDAMIWEGLRTVHSAQARVQHDFLQLSADLQRNMGLALALQHSPVVETANADTEVVLDRRQCLEFARGSIGQVLGARFVAVDRHPTRVRLPDEPLMLVDRILHIEGEAGILRHQPDAQGRVVTEHEVLAGAWYLDGERVPICIAVEAGQADLFLSAWLGIDHVTRGESMYRLLDAQVEFHDELPGPGQCIRYDIRIERFFRQRETWLFRFHFEAQVNGRPLLSMSQGCAGFFSAPELAAGRGIVPNQMSGTVSDRVQSQAIADPDKTLWLAPKPRQQVAYSEEQLQALRKGDLKVCFGDDFAPVQLHRPYTLPGGRMELVHRILRLSPDGGRYGLGNILGEADIHPDDWFLRCHFVDDQVMPGTLMYEGCLQVLRVFLLRMGWLGEVGELRYQPMRGVRSQLKCRGQVTCTTRKVRYEIDIRELGYQDDGCPYAIADALMYADQRPIVQMRDMSLRLCGLRYEALHLLWQARASRTTQDILFDNESILAFAVGKPSQAFGERYRVFDDARVIARLPGPPYKFLDRIVRIENCVQWEMHAGGEIDAEYDVPEDAWYFDAERQPRMPFAILLEVVLQPCGWLAAYMGSALYSEGDLSFRNLGGMATQHGFVGPKSGTLRTTVRSTKVSHSGGMIIQHYDYVLRGQDGGLLYQGNTYFGFFSKEALANQLGIRGVQHYSTAGEMEDGHDSPVCYPEYAPFPNDQLRMVEEILHHDPQGGPHGLGYIKGRAKVRPEAWFFKAHFYQDPVWPGSLGLESLLQLMKFHACHRFGSVGEQSFRCMAVGQGHEWLYRGQILPADHTVLVEAVFTGWDERHALLSADGLLSVDGRLIYQMRHFTLCLLDQEWT